MRELFSAYGMHTYPEQRMVNRYTHCVSRIGIFRSRRFEISIVEAAHGSSMSDGNDRNFKDADDEKTNS